MLPNVVKLSKKRTGVRVREWPFPLLILIPAHTYHLSGASSLPCFLIHRLPTTTPRQLQKLRLEDALPFTEIPLPRASNNDPNPRSVVGGRRSEQQFWFLRIVINLRRYLRPAIQPPSTLMFRHNNSPLLTFADDLKARRRVDCRRTEFLTRSTPGGYLSAQCLCNPDGGSWFLPSSFDSRPTIPFRKERQHDKSIEPFRHMRYHQGLNGEVKKGCNSCFLVSKLKGKRTREVSHASSLGLTSNLINTPKRR